MSDTTHNGWTNYATWRINLEICDDYIESRAEDIRAGYADKWADEISLADELQAATEEAIGGFGELETKKTADIAFRYAIAFIADVNWYEIAATCKTDNPDLFEDDSDE